MQRHLDDLNTFLVVAEERSFTRAAAKLGTSQSSLSHVIQRLETKLGVRLLTRTTRSVTATAAGERLVATLRPALDSIDAQLGLLSDFRDKPAGNIRITASEHACTSLLWPALIRLLPRYPDIQVELSIDTSLTDIVSEKFDAGIRLGGAIARDMIAVKIGPDLRMAVVGSPAYFAEHGIPYQPQDLARHSCINLRMLSSGGLYAWELGKDGRELRVRVQGRIAVNNARIQVEAALAGFGLAFVIEDRVQPYLESGELQRVMEDWTEPFSGYHLYYPSRRQHSAAFSLLVDALRYPARQPV